MIGTAACKAAVDLLAADPENAAMGTVLTVSFSDENGAVRTVPIAAFSDAKRTVPTAAFVPLGAGGVLKGLWDLGEALHSGMEVDIRKIPIRQKTIEICEKYHIDPYYADATGAYLVAAYDAHGIEWKLRAEGVECAVIGILTESKARKILYPRHVRYLDKPRQYE